jgi:hypothetical protein
MSLSESKFLSLCLSINSNFVKGVCGETCHRLCNSTTQCDTNPCWFGGTCVDVASLDYACLCPPNHSGKDCRIVLTCQSTSCYNGGSCFQSGMLKNKTRSILIN